MKQLPGKMVEKFPFENFKWVKDIDYYDGPLSSHFKNLNDDYLVYWCDVLTDSHRWLIIKTSIDTIEKLIKTNYKLFPIESLDNYVYITDIRVIDNGDPIYLRTSIAELNEVPSDYFPSGFTT